MKDIDNPGQPVIGFTAGSWDLLHAGHVLMFADCKKVCDYLIVGLQTDPTLDRDYKNTPIQSIEERHIQLAGLRYVDEIHIYSTEAELYDMLQTLQIDVRILGSDWKDKPFTGHDLPIKNYFHTREHAFSTSELRERIYLEENRKRL